MRTVLVLLPPLILMPKESNLLVEIALLASIGVVLVVVVNRIGTVHSLLVVGTAGTNPLLTVRFNA